VKNARIEDAIDGLLNDDAAFKAVFPDLDVAEARTWWEQTCALAKAARELIAAGEATGL
jgi:hypothetical protein